MPGRRFKTWPSRVTFVRDSLKKMAILLETPPEGLDVSLLADLFGLDDVRPDARGGTRRRPGPGGPMPMPPQLPEGPPRWFRISQNSRGFHVRRDPALEVPARAKLRVAFAYEGAGANPIARHDPIDFDLRGGNETLLTPNLLAEGAEAAVVGANVIEMEPTADEFRVRVTGFDLGLDLYVRATEAGGEA